KCTPHTAKPPSSAPVLICWLKQGSRRRPGRRAPRRAAFGRPPRPAPSTRTRSPAMPAETAASARSASLRTSREAASDGPRSTLLPAHPSTREERGPNGDSRGAGAVFVAVGALPGTVGFNLLLDAHTRDVGGHSTAGLYTLALGVLSAGAAGFALRGHLPNR